MSPKVNTTLLSAAVISGLLVSAAPAQASEATDETAQIVSIAEQSTGPELLVPAASAVGQDVLPAAPAVTETRAGDEAAADPALAAPEAETGGTEGMAVDSSADDSAVETAAPAADATEEPAAPGQVEESTADQKTEPATEVEEAQQVAVAASATDEAVDFAYVEGAELDKALLKSLLESEAVQQLAEEFGDLEPELSEDEQAFWDAVDELLPEGSEYWDDEQWDTFYETEEGQQVLQLVEDEFELDEPEWSDEDQQFLDEMMTLMPEGAEGWTDAR